MSAYTLVWFVLYYRCFLAIDILFKLCYTLVIKTLPLITPSGSPLLNQSRNCPSSKFGIQYFTVTSSWRILCHTHVWSPIFIVQPSWFVVKSVCILTFVAWISISSGQFLFTSRRDGNRPHRIVGQPLGTANDVGHWDQKHPKVLIVGKKNAKNLIAMYSGPTQFKNNEKHEKRRNCCYLQCFCAVRSRNHCKYHGFWGSGGQKHCNLQCFFNQRQKTRVVFTMFSFTP